MVPSPELGDAVLDGVVREASLRPHRQERVVCKDRRGEQKRGFTQDLWGAGRRLGGRFGKAGLCKPHSDQPRGSTSQGGSRWSPSLDPPSTSNEELNPMCPQHISSLPLFFFQVHPSMVVRMWREKGQELRVAGIYELRVQHAFGEGEGKRAPFAKTIFNFFKRQLQSHD